ncbi:RtcB family protein [Dactylosporangium sp. CA-139114]|uniref:RtcB family protein n=1 Tax=Dactylosporangium sp. CA-139114 TaxID=3239931 RepID=UPI003D9992AB
MARLDVDYFEAHFADAPGRGVRLLMSSYLLGSLFQSSIMAQAARIARLPYLAGPISIYPDASPKPFGFPAGIVVTTEPGWLYPLSAPDMGCGYLVVDTGIEIDPEAINDDLLNETFDGLVASIDVGSPEREKVSTSARAIMMEGISTVGAPVHFGVASAEAEESSSWSPRVDLLEASFVASDLQASLGSAAGHFVACYVVERSLSPASPPVGRVIVVVHVGAAPVRDHLNKLGVFAELAALAIDKAISTAEDAAEGLFAVDLSSSHGGALLGAAMASRNFGYANRQLVADTVVRVLRSRLKRYAACSAVQLRHVDHVAFESVDGAIRSRRGLQPLHEHRPIFITGGEHTHGYLATTGRRPSAVDGLCCHGTPVRNTEVVPLSAMAGVEPDLSPSSARRWADAMVSNTRFDEGRFWSDSANLEIVMSYLAESEIAHPAARLRQLMNYRELKL